MRAFLAIELPDEVTFALSQVAPPIAQNNFLICFSICKAQCHIDRQKPNHASCNRKPRQCKPQRAFGENSAPFLSEANSRRMPKCHGCGKTVTVMSIASAKPVDRCAATAGIASSSTSTPLTALTTVGLAAARGRAPQLVSSFSSARLATHAVIAVGSFGIKFTRTT